MVITRLGQRPKEPQGGESVSGKLKKSASTRGDQFSSDEFLKILQAMQGGVMRGRNLVLDSEAQHKEKAKTHLRGCVGFKRKGEIEKGYNNA